MIAANPQFIQWILKVKSNIDSGQFKPLMLAASKALECDKEWYDDVNKTYASRRLIAEDIMRALGCHFDPAQRGLFLWGRIPDQYEGTTRRPHSLRSRRIPHSGIYFRFQRQPIYPHLALRHQRENARSATAY